MSRLLILLVLATSPALSMTADDFARGRDVTVDDALVQRVVLPADVYQWTSRADLGDLRVLDGRGNLVPQALRPPQPEPPLAPWQSIPWFVLPASRDDAASSVNIQLGADGTVIAVQGAVGDATARSAFLLDASGLDRPIASIRLQWRPDGGDFVARVRLEGSDDLNDWHTLVASATVARLGDAAAGVNADHLAIDGPRRRYLRLTQRDGDSALPLAGVAVQPRVAGQPVRHWLALEPQGAPLDDIDGWLTFDSAGHFPVDRLRVLVAGGSWRGEVRVQSRARSEGPWQDHGRHAVYQVVLEGAADAAPATRSDGLAVSPVTHRYWRLQWLSREGAATGSTRLEIGWLPHEVLFLRSGESPHLLAYGRAGLDGASWPLAELTDRLGGTPPQALPPRPLGAPRLLGGPDRLVPAPAPIDWQTLVLWAVLIAGVALVAGLAWRLLR